MEVNLVKAKEYYSRLTDSELLDYLTNKQFELHSDVLHLIEDILKSRGFTIDDVKTERSKSRETKSKSYSPFSWLMVLGAFTVVIVLYTFGSGTPLHPFEKEFGLVLVVAGALGYVLLPIILMFVIKYSRLKKGEFFDIKEVLFYGCGIGIVFLILSIIIS